MWTKTADEIPEEQKEPEVGLSDDRKRGIAYGLSELLEDFVGEQWGNLIDGMGLTEEEKQWAHETLRWTIIDENTGEDLVGGEGH